MNEANTNPCARALRAVAGSVRAMVGYGAMIYTQVSLSCK